MMKKALSIGLMSGTSMDGIDAALIETDGESVIQAVGFLSLPYTNEFIFLLKSAELAVRLAAGDLAIAETKFPLAISQYLSQELGLTSQALQATQISLANYLAPLPLTLQHVIQHFTELHATLVLKLLAAHAIQANQIEVIGFHGQTVLHKPEAKISIQLGDGKHLANLLGIKVVNDFRRADVLAGGQGAPLVPLFHLALAKNTQKIPAAIVNCGGIANVTVLPNQEAANMFGFDTGPGNNLVDRYVKQMSQGKLTMDQEGEIGKKGKCHADFLTLLYKNSIRMPQGNYFELPPPKSLDSSDLHLIPELQSLSHEDACRTLEAFTADSIVQSVANFSPQFPTTWILCGGGWSNPVIRFELDERLAKHHAHAYHANDIGWHSQALEAQAFAYFAVRHLKNLPISFPKTTRVSAPTVGGVLNLP